VPSPLPLAALLVGALACAAAPDAAPARAPEGVWDARARAFVAPDALFARAARARFVLLGERHDHPEHHRLQARVVRALVARGRRPAVCFEMLSADVAPALEAALAGGGATSDAVRGAVGWDRTGWPPFALYAPVFDAALDAGLPLCAADLAREAVRSVGRGGLAELAPALAARLALFPAPEPIRAALAEEIRESHCGFAPEARIGPMVDLQWTRDAHLAAALADASGADGAVLVTGAGHARRDRAVPLHLGRLVPGAGVVSVAFLEEPPGADASALLASLEGAFDYAWLTPRLDEADPCEKFRPALERLRQGAPPAPQEP
jgi:uncharacterized iron-regulated protein